MKPGDLATFSSVNLSYVWSCYDKHENCFKGPDRTVSSTVVIVAVVHAASFCVTVETIGWCRPQRLNVVK
jgi:hypothetical protein